MGSIVYSRSSMHTCCSSLVPRHPERTASPAAADLGCLMSTPLPADPCHDADRRPRRLPTPRNPTPDRSLALGRTAPRQSRRQGPLLLTREGGVLLILHPSPCPPPLPISPNPSRALCRKRDQGSETSRSSNAPIQRQRPVVVPPSYIPVRIHPSPAKIVGSSFRSGRLK
jgi:hypothetical protein